MPPPPHLGVEGRVVLRDVERRISGCVLGLCQLRACESELQLQGDVLGVGGVATLLQVTQLQGNM